MSAHQPNPKKTPGWCSKTVKEKDKLNFKRSIANYIVRNCLEDELPHANMETYKSCLYEISLIDQRWSEITSDNFNTGQFSHHREFANTIRNTLQSKKVLEELVKKRKDEVEKIRLEESDSESEE